MAINRKRHYRLHSPSGRRCTRRLPRQGRSRRRLSTEVHSAIVGLTGAFGSGCSYIAQEFIQKRQAYQYISLSRILRRIYVSEHPTSPEPTRQDLQDFGDEIRNRHGASYLAQEALREIRARDDVRFWVVDSFRNPSEIAYFQNLCTNFYLFGVYADSEVRWNRVKETYNENERSFREDDKRDAEEDDPKGQQVTACYIMADAMITNNCDYHAGSDAQRTLGAKISRLLDFVEGEQTFTPNETEALMAMAFANSLRSSCLKRQVGAIIVDDYGNVCSSGYNEVPKDDAFCKYLYGDCYRDILRKDLVDQIATIIDSDEVRKEVNKVCLKRFKVLDYCRALHAEENAIVNVARFGSSSVLRDATLYTTTYPCNLCANKIAQVGIGKVIYLEPYPMAEAKLILTNNRVIQEPFEGVSFNGYFRFKRRVYEI